MRMSGDVVNGWQVQRELTKKGHLPAGANLNFAQGMNLVSMRRNGAERVDEEGRAPWASKLIRRVSGVTQTVLGIADGLVVVRTPYAPYLLRGDSIAVARSSERAIELAWFSAARPRTAGDSRLPVPESFRPFSPNGIDVTAARLQVIGKGTHSVDEIVARVNAEVERSLNALDPIWVSDVANIRDEVARLAFR